MGLDKLRKNKKKKKKSKTIYQMARHRAGNIDSNFSPTITVIDMSND